MFAVAVITVIALQTSPSQAQSGVERQQQQILQQQEQRQRALERKQRTIAPPSASDQAVEPAPQAPLAKGRCVKIDKIEIEGAPLLPPEERSRTREKYRGKCLSLLELNDVLRDITNWYVEAGYVTTRAYLPEQALDTGLLHIKVLEGRVGAVALRENGQPRSGVNSVLPALNGERLNIRDVEQGLDQINRLPSFDAKVRLEPGKTEGETDVVIDAVRGRSWRASATYDNFGVPSTGRRQVGATAEVDDLLGLYDFLSISAGGDAGEDFSDVSHPGRASRNVSAFYAVPMGYWTASISSSFFAYETPISVAGEPLVSSGHSLNHRLELQRVVHRDQVSKTFVATSLASKETKNYIDDNLLDVSSRRLTTASVRVSHARSQWGGVLNISGIAERGLRILGALRDRQALDDTTPRAQFTKGTLEASYARPFEIAGQKFLMSTSLVASYSPNTLFSTERLSAGGRYTVRGFNEHSISGDVGAYSRNELIWSLPPVADVSRWIGNVDLFVAYDAGWIKADHLDPFEGGKVQGIAGGARFTKGAAFGEITAEKALSAPNYMDPDSYIVGFRFGVTSDAF